MPHGTWTTTGGGSRWPVAVAAIIGAALLIGSGALATAVTAITNFLLVLLLCVLAAVVIIAAVALLVWRRHGGSGVPVPEQIASFQEAHQVRATQRPAVAAPAQHWHLHFHGEQPEGVLQAITDAKERSSNGNQ